MWLHAAPEPGYPAAMSTPQDERPDQRKDASDEDPQLDQVQRPMDDPQTRPALDPEADPPEDA